MSKIDIVCCRNKKLNISNDEIKQCFQRITTPNFIPIPPIIERYSSILVGIFNPTEGAYFHSDKCTYLGKLFASCDNYAGYKEIGASVPDGSFILSRYNDQFLELVAVI